MLCRVCLESSGDGFDIFAARGLKLNAAEILTKHLFFEPKIDDPISTNICTECWHIVRNFNKFYERIESEHEIYFANCILKNDQNPNEHIILKSNGQDMEIVEETERTDDCETAALLAVETVKSETTDSIHMEDLQDIDPLAEDLGGDSARSETMHSENDDKDDYDSDDIVLSALKKPAPRKRAKRSKPNNSKTEAKAPSLSVAERNKLFDKLISDNIKLHCDKCQEELGTFAQLLEHKRQEHAEEQPHFICCKHKYFKRYHLVQHIRFKHSSSPGEECPICHKVVRHLKKHLMCTHAKEEELKFTCDKCSRKFVKSYLLKRHKVRECRMQEANILCERCHKKFTNLYLLRRHMIVHQVAGDAVPWDTYNCDKCPRVFSYPYQLREHMTVHGEAPHKCNVCLKGFSRSESLAKHMQRKHSAEREAKDAKKREEKEKLKRKLT